MQNAKGELRNANPKKEDTHMSKNVKTVGSKNEAKVNKSNESTEDSTMKTQVAQVEVVGAGEVAGAIETEGTATPLTADGSVASGEAFAEGKVRNTNGAPSKDKTAAALAKLTEQYVGKINGVATNELASWKRLGQLIDEFVKKLNPNGKKAKRDPYVLLSRHPSCVHQPGQLRNHHASFVLFTEFGGEDKAPKLPMTHYIAVLGKSLTIEKKRTLLKAAVDDELTVSELKARAYAMRGNGNPNPNPNAPAWDITRVTSRANSLFDVLVGINGKVTAANPMPDAIRTDIRSSLLQVVDSPSPTAT
jgi:hypothetical protein